MENIRKEIKEAIDWVATEYHYMKELLQKLYNPKNELLNKAIDLREFFKETNQLKRILKKIGRSEKKSDHYIKIIKDYINNNIKNLTQEETELLKQIKVEEGYLEQAFSLYVGSIPEELNDLITQIKIAEKEHKKEIYEEILKLVDHLITNIEAYIKWAQALEETLDKLYKSDNFLEDVDEFKKTSRRRFLKTAGALIGSLAGAYIFPDILSKIAFLTIDDKHKETIGYKILEIEKKAGLASIEHFKKFNFLMGFCLSKLLKNNQLPRIEEITKKEQELIKKQEIKPNEKQLNKIKFKAITEIILTYTKEDAKKLLTLIAKILHSTKWKHKGIILLSSALKKNTFDCDTLSYIYASIAQVLGIKLALVFLPEHVFTRYIGNKGWTLNWDVNNYRQGENQDFLGTSISNEEYIKNFHIPIDSKIYLNSLDPNNYQDFKKIKSSIYNNIGTFYYTHGNPKKSEYYFRKAIKFDEKNADAYVSLSNIYLIKQREEENKRKKKLISEQINAYIELALNLNKNYAEAYVNKGMVLLRMDTTKDINNKALDCFKKAVSLGYNISNLNIPPKYINLLNSKTQKRSIK